MSGNSTDNNSRPVARRVHKGRVGGCLAVFLIIFILLITLINGCTKKHQNQKKQPEKTGTSVSTQITEPVAVQTPAPKRDYIICVDPGHGGDDIGSSNGDRLEKVDNLRYATEVFNLLQNMDGIQPFITRTSNDTELTNKERAAIANERNADLYLALHRNQLEDHTANGVEIWIQQESDVIDQVLGFKLLTELKKVGIQNDRGVHSGYTNDSQNNFQIIEYTNMPACIVELGFISNDEDNRLFDEHYKDYAAAIAEVVKQLCDEGFLEQVREQKAE